MSAAISDGGTAADTPAAACLRSIIGKRLLLADGSTGTALEAMAPELAASGRLALLPLERPDLVESLHDAYFAAGSDLVETATFSASARDLARFAGGHPGGAAALCYGVNRAAAAIAARSARRAEAQGPGGSGREGDSLRSRLVAGSIGPGDAPPSLGASTYAELFESYLPQARGLADGGADLAIVETCQDPLQIKAALAALGSPEGGRGLPFIVSATVDGRGRMLAGADIAAFVAIAAPFGPLALGLNCSGGPDELEVPLAELAALSPFPLCLMPNAGLPCSSGGCTTYPFGPELFAAKVEALARRFGLAVAGGCCGTTPAHIAALHSRLADRPAASARPLLRPALASLYSARNIGPGLFKIGERANSAGSAAFAALLDAEDFEGMAEKALAQEASGAAAIDLHLSRPGRDEADDLERLAALIAPRAQAALCLDSGDPKTLERVLPLVGGRPLVNSTSLEDPERARRVFALAARFGAAVVCLAMDGAGPARTVADKVRVCRALYDMATGEFGLQPQALLFDPLTFTIAAGGDAAATIEAIGAVKAACPDSLTVLGVGNVSYGLPKSTRAAVTSLFLEAATRAGLDAAIMDTAGVLAPESIDPRLKAAALTALGLVAAGGDASADATAGEPGDRLDALLAWAAEKAKAGKGAGAAAPGTVAATPGQASGEPETADPASRLKAALSRGDKVSAEALGREVAALRGSAALMSLVTEAMAESGRLWNEGRLSLPLVLRSAEAARRALAPATEGASAAEAKGVVVMATVKGDLHDIGKNIVAAILACSGWKVVDLGTDAPAAAIVEAAKSHNAIAVGLSGLLTRSLAEMRATCAALAAAGIRCLVLCGGAAVSADFVAREIEPLHPGLVSACPNAFAAAELLDRAAEARAAAPQPPAKPTGDASAAVAAAAASPSAPSPESRPIAPKAKPAFEPPFLGAADPRGIPFRELLARLNRPTLFAARWGYSRRDFAKAETELASLLGEAEILATPRFVYGYYSVKALDDTHLQVGAAASPDLAPRSAIGASAAVGAAPAPPLVLPFPRESSAARRTLAAYFCPEGDVIAFFAATAGPGLGCRARELKNEGKLEAYWHLHGLGSALAEAAAQYAHDLIGAEILASGAESAGKRYSFGFPACPGLEYQAPLLELLGAGRVGISATSGHQLDPEHSVTAFVVARADAAYFGV